MSKHPGATPADWQHFSEMLGLTADLLPVVSNPDAAISPMSKMKTLGKTPSILNANGQVAGIPDWPQKVASARDIEVWSAVHDYGICLQTRGVRAIDIDVPDEARAAAIAEGVLMLYDMPERYRVDSGKRLLLFRMAGEHGKRHFKVEGGLVEALMTGQQCVVAGRHVDGERYQWRGGLPMVIPELTIDEFNALWSSLERAWALSPGVVGGVGGVVSRRGVDVVPDDPVAAFLRRSGAFRGDDRDRVYLTCPWVVGHSGDSGETETAWFKAGSNGVDRGRFKCLHASCGGRTEREFLESVGWMTDGFEAIERPVDAVPALARVSEQKWLKTGADIDYCDLVDHVGVNGHAVGGFSDLSTNVISLRARGALPVRAQQGDLPDLDRNQKTGRVKATLDNCVNMIRRPDIIGFEVAFDEFRDCVLLGSHTDGWQRVGDNHYTEIRLRLQSWSFEPVSRDMVRDAVLYLSDENKFDSAKMWLEGWEWDGKERIGGFMHRYMRAKDTPYNRAMGEYIWTALPGRVLVPGIKADIVPIWRSREGTAKTSSVEAIAPDSDMFVEISFLEDDKETARKMRGKVIGEIAELNGLNTRANEAILAWVTRTTEEFTPKYQEYSTSFHRRLLCIGTTNNPKMLPKGAGRRRWAPTDVGTADINALRKDRNQLWAEGCARFKQDGILWGDLENLARDEWEHYSLGDVMQDDLETWLKRIDPLTGECPAEQSYLTSSQILQDCFGMSKGIAKRNEEMKLNVIMREIGYNQFRKYVDGSVLRVWEKKSIDLA